jgi:hypothetical protein
VNIWGTEYGEKLGELIWNISQKINFPELFLDVIWEYAQICENYEDPEVAFLIVRDQKSILNFDFSKVMINEEQIKIWVKSLEIGYKEKLFIDPQYYLKDKVEENL